MPAERQGSRWLYAPPTEDELREWFRSQRLHDGMEHEPYMGGIVLIGASERYRQTMRKRNSEETYVVESERTVHVPYVKVDTRIAYFWDMVRVLNGGDLLGKYLGVIRPVPQHRIPDPASPYFNLHLPEGFFRLPVQNKDGNFTNYFGCVRRVAIYERESYVREKNEAVALIEGIATKQTLTGKTWADDNALMKVETSAVGRALGMAGILVVGTGVASAEDMQEFEGGTGGEAAAREPSLPPAASPQAPGPATGTEPLTPDQEAASLIAKIGENFAKLESDFPEQASLTGAGVTEITKGTPLRDLPLPALKGIAIRVERDLDAARNAALAR
jgi:hypothetical protein